MDGPGSTPLPLHAERTRCPMNPDLRPFSPRLKLHRHNSTPAPPAHGVRLAKQKHTVSSDDDKAGLLTHGFLTLTTEPCRFLGSFSSPRKSLALGGGRSECPWLGPKAERAAHVVGGVIMFHQACGGCMAAHGHGCHRSTPFRHRTLQEYCFHP